MSTGAGGLLGPQAAGILIGLAIAVPILLFRAARPRKLRVELLWVRPAIWLVIAAASFAGAPPPISPLSIAVLAAGLAVGGALGWRRGRLMRIEVDPETHQMTMQASPAAMLFILVLMVLRAGARDAALGSLAQTHVPVSVVMDALILFSLGLMVVQGLELWIRGRRLLAEAWAAKPKAA